MISLCRAGDRKRVERLLQAGYDPNFASGQWSALSIACMRGDDRMAHLLLDAGAVPVNPGGPEPLLLASQRGDQRVVAWLLDAGASIHVRSPHCGDTALHVAARHGQRAMVDFLIARGADVNAVNLYKQTPLFNAATQAVAERLVLHGALGVIRNAELRRRMMRFAESFLKRHARIQEAIMGADALPKELCRIIGSFCDVSAAARAGCENLLNIRCI